MQQSKEGGILASAPVAEKAAVTEHFTGFVNSFVQKDRRERWLHLLIKCPKQIFNDSHKLHSHLDRSKCSEFKDESQINSKDRGVYYDFFDEPVILNAADALVVSRGKDAIFSIIPGELAIYFFHEDENLICKV